MLIKGLVVQEGQELGNGIKIIFFYVMPLVSVLGFILKWHTKMKC